MDAVRIRHQFASGLTIALIIALLPSVTYPASPAGQAIRVELTRLGHPACVAISASSGAISVSTPNARATTPSLELRPYASRVACKSPKDGQTFAGEWIRIEPVDPAAALRLECAGKLPKCVRGAVEARIANSGIRLVNEIALEDYVLGVLPAEMPESYPLDALKAQAVTIRTYALRNRGKHSYTAADVCDSQHCQTYAGLPQGKARCLAAVQATTGLILTYDGEPAHVFYSADGGGSTQNYADAHPNRGLPYLCGVKDPDGVPHTSWEKSYTLAELAALLTRAGIKDATGLQTIRIADLAATGRVLSVEVTGQSGTAKKVYAGKLRDVLGLDEFKSTLFTVDSTQQGIVTFKGKGYGHGIGLCQIGAKGLAQQPFNYTWDRILSHYFPGTAVTSLAPTRLAKAPPPTKPLSVASSPRTTPIKTPPRKVSQPPRKETPKKPQTGELAFDVKLIDPDLP